VAVLLSPCEAWVCPWAMRASFVCDTGFAGFLPLAKIESKWRVGSNWWGVWATGGAQGVAVAVLLSSAVQEYQKLMNNEYE
jgi:hypothetical protein